MQNVKKLLPVAFMLLAGFGFQGCTDFEEGAVVGGVVGGIVAGDRGHYRHRGYYHHCRGYYCTESAQLDTMGAQGTVAKVAQKFDIPMDSAQVLVAALEQAEARDFSALTQMGLQKEDFAAIYHNQNPSVSALEKMSVALNMDIGATHDLIQDIKTDIALGRADGSIPNY